MKSCAELIEEYHKVCQELTQAEADGDEQAMDEHAFALLDVMTSLRGRKISAMVDNPEIEVRGEVVGTIEAISNGHVTLATSVGYVLGDVKTMLSAE